MAIRHGSTKTNISYLIRKTHKLLRIDSVQTCIISMCTDHRDCAAEERVVSFHAAER